MFGYLWVISTGSYVLMFALGILALGAVYSAANAIGTRIGFAVAGVRDEGRLAV